VSWLLDTNAVSELARPRPNHGVIAWLADHPDEARLFISALTLAEIYRGVLRLDPRHRRLTHLRSWLEGELPARFAGRILAFDDRVARTRGEMSAVVPKGTTVLNMDSWIAATARHHRWC
jgi:predicted nucleic acid-binding protein